MLKKNLEWAEVNSILAGVFPCLDNKTADRLEKILRPIRTSPIATPNEVLETMFQFIADAEQDTSYCTKD